MTPDGEQPSVAWFPDLLEPLTALQIRGHVRVALSGGLDSIVLLHLSRQIFARHPGGFSAVHVNHQLQQAASGFEALCRQVCDSLAIPLQIIPLNLDIAPDGSSGSVETAARKARYQVLSELQAPGDGLLMAHHADDHAETVLFRMLRGSGVAGLAGIPAERSLGNGRIVRPWLGITRQRLEQQARDAGLQWVEDPTNNDIQHDRNFLRHQVMPLLRQRWPELDRRLAATATACGEAARLSGQLAKHQLSVLSDHPDRISRVAFAALPPEGRKNLLRHWCGETPAINETSIDELLNAADDRHPEIRGRGFALRRFGGHIYRVPQQSASEPVISEAVLEPGQELLFGGFRIRLIAEAPRTGQQGEAFRVALRRGGERLRPDPGAGSRALKKWLQEKGVPPWQRSGLPLVFHGDELVAVADLWCAEGYRGGSAGTDPGPSSGVGWRIDIRRDFD